MLILPLRCRKYVHLLNDISNQFNFHHDDFFNIFYSLNIIFSYIPLNIVFSTLFKINFEKHTRLSNFIFLLLKKQREVPSETWEGVDECRMCSALTQCWWNLSAYSCVWHRRTSGSHKCKITSLYIWQSHMQNQNHIVVHLTATHEKSKSHSRALGNHTSKIKITSSCIWQSHKQNQNHIVVHLAVIHAKSKSHRRTSGSHTCKIKITSSFIWQSHLQNQNHIVVHLTLAHSKSKSHIVVHLEVTHAKSKSHIVVHLTVAHSKSKSHNYSRTSGSHTCKIKSSYIWQSHFQNHKVTKIVIMTLIVK